MPPSPDTPSTPSGLARELALALLPALLPALVLALTGFWAGTFAGGATAAGATAGHLAVAALALVGLWTWGNNPRGGRRELLLDPLRLGSGRWLLWAVLAWAFVSWLASPVRLAGIAGLCLAPLLLWAVAGVARCWGDPTRRRWGLLGVSLVVAAVAAWSLFAWSTGRGPRPALPLGHHNLLATWLVLTLPLALSPLAVGEARARRLPAPVRGLIGLAAGLPLLALLASRSLSGLLALGTMGAVAALWALGDRRRGRRGRGGFLEEGRGRRRAAVLAGGLLVGLAVGAAGIFLQGPRLLEIAAGTDPSLGARGVYWHGGLTGLAERPLRGWGPGSTAWTLAEHLAPMPGAVPPGEVVGELHLLPLTAAYELGLPGFLLLAAVVAWFVRVRLREARHLAASGGDPFPLRVGLLVLLGGTVAGVGTGDWRILALGVAAAAAAGTALGGGLSVSVAPGRQAGEEEEEDEPRSALPAWAALLVPALLLGSLLWTVDRPHRAYDRMRAAAAAGAPVTSAAPGGDHPLARIRRVWASGADRAERHRQALVAAEEAHGVAFLWLEAGRLAPAGEGLAGRQALERACRLAPLDGLAPFFLATGPGGGPGEGEPDRQTRARLGARALAASPVLGAALAWERHPGLLEASMAVLEAEEGLDRGWREALLRSLVEGEPRAGTAPGETPPGGTPPGGAAEVSTVGLAFDATPATSPSLHLFRRSPWPHTLAPVPVRRGAAERLGALPSAADLASTAPSVFDREGCRAAP